jgi:alpha-galactosidase
MTEQTLTLMALAPHNYLDTTASPLGRALRRQPLVQAGIDGAGLEALALSLDTANGQQSLHAVHPDGLRLSVDIEPDRSHQALVWHLAIAQSDERPGPRLHDLCPLRIVLDGTLIPDAVIHTWLGGAMQTFFPPDAITPQRHVLYPRTPAYYQAGRFTIGTRGGRSSDQYMPYLLITNAEDSAGLWCAIGWSGNWRAHFVKPQGSVDLHLTVHIEPCDFRPPAGARLRGPSLALGLYEGDSAAGCNALRDWLRSRMPALPTDDLSHFNTWTAFDADVDEATLLRAADSVAGLGLRSFMLDAGWYPCSRDSFSTGVGNWRVDETKFPRGLEVVAERVRANGMEMGLWIEPERAHESSELARQHPDWLLPVAGSPYALVNFALPEVRAHFRTVIGDLVRRLGLHWLKWDFNMDPLPAWRGANDGGLSHLGHVNGIWETFVWLRATFPQLVIENCASGGNRLDWALFSRVHVNFANDQYTQPDCIRRILGRMGAFLPSERLNMIYGPYQRRKYGDADWQVLKGSAFGVSEPVDNWSEHFKANLRRHLALHRETEALRRGSFYRLTPDTADLHAWEVWQLHDPATGAGVLALWRSGAPDERMLVRPRALAEESAYTVTDLYSGEARSITGGQFAAGFEVRLPPDGAALYSYRKAL